MFSIFTEQGIDDTAKLLNKHTSEELSNLPVSRKKLKAKIKVLKQSLPTSLIGKSFLTAVQVFLVL
jgi:hypothetical protein